MWAILFGIFGLTFFERSSQFIMLVDNVNGSRIVIAYLLQPRSLLPRLRPLPSRILRVACE